MLYDSTILEPATEDVILSKTTEYDIYSYYIGHRLIIGSKFNSPLRKDNNPSFGLFISKTTNSLLFKDQSTGESGNCFKFVQLKCHLGSYREAMNRVSTDLSLNLLEQSTQGLNVRNNYKATRTDIKIKRKNFTKTDDNYWMQFNIYRNVLKRYNVYPISHVWLNDNLMSWKYSETTPMYAYQIYNKFKIYRPLNSTDEKWMSNCTVNNIQGYAQLPETGDLLIITKSLKDVMTLYSLGYTAVSANSENTLIPLKVMNDLRQRFKRIVVFYDNDPSGQKGAKEMAQTYNVSTVEIPTSYKSKDISDFIKDYDKEKTLDLLQTLTDTNRYGETISRNKKTEYKR